MNISLVLSLNLDHIERFTLSFRERQDPTFYLQLLALLDASLSTSVFEN